MCFALFFARFSRQGAGRASNEPEDFKDAKLWIIETTLRERYGEMIDFRLADSDLRLRPTDRDLTPCPLVYWEVGNCHFVIVKTGDRRYRCQFYYRLHQQDGTGANEYDDLSECAVSLLQVQADHERAAPKPDRQRVQPQ